MSKKKIDKLLSLKDQFHAHEKTKKAKEKELEDKRAEHFAPDKVSTQATDEDTLVQEFRAFVEPLHENILAIAIEQQRLYDEYFELYKTLDPKVAKDLPPSLIPPIVTEYYSVIDEAGNLKLEEE